MKKFKISIMLFAALLGGVCLTACDDANEYEDANTDNPSWVNNYNDSLAIAHPESLAGTTWVRGSGLKTNAYGEDVQGYVESITFESDSAIIKMSEPVYPSHFDSSKITWTDESNSATTPKYEYTYSSVTGAIQILKMVQDDKGKVSKSAIFSGVANSDPKQVITMMHPGDVPVQTYLVKQ